MRSELYLVLRALERVGLDGWIAVGVDPSTVQGREVMIAYAGVRDHEEARRA